MITILPLIVLLSLLGAVVVTSAPSFAHDVAVASSRAAKFDHAKACGGNNFCLTVQVGDNAFVNFKNLFQCGVTSSGDWNDGQLRSYVFDGSCSGQFYMDCPNSNGAQGFKALSDFNFALAGSGGSSLSSSDINITATCTDGQSMDPSKVPGAAIIYTREPWADFTITCKWKAR